MHALHRLAAVAGAGLLAFVGLTSPAQAAEERYPAPADGAWQVQGRGWGHGIGMSQWGAQGAAQQGRTVNQILDFYYPGTATGTVPESQTLRVALSALTPTDTVTLWNPPAEPTFYLNVAGQSPRALGAGRLTVTRASNGYTIERRTALGGSPVETVHVTGTELRISTAGETGVVVAKDTGATSGTWYRGSIRIAPGGTGPDQFAVINDVQLGHYLQGVVPREMGASFHIEALKAQAIAARSYALATKQTGNYFDTCDTTACQVYGGRATVSHARSITQEKEAPRTTEAVRGTAGQVRTYQGRVAQTYFSADNGGHTVAAGVPYLLAKPDPYTGSATNSPRTTWTDTLPVAAVARYCPSGGALRTLVVTGRDGNGPLGGRITSVRLECTSGNVDLRASGPFDISLRFGLYSQWWRPLAGPEPESGFFLNDSWTTTANHVFQYGRPDDEVFVGDWNGDGTDTLAVRRGSTFYVSNALRGGAADVVLTYGRPGDTILVGDWDGDGTDTLAVRRGAAYHIKNSVTSGAADQVVIYGRADDDVLVGDWDGNGTDTLAVRRGAAYHIKNSISAGKADRVVIYGRADDDVYVGDWDGTGTDTLAVRRSATFHVKNSLTAGAADLVLTYGRPNDVVLVGDWNGDGTDTLGVRRVS